VRPDPGSVIPQTAPLDEAPDEFGVQGRGCTLYLSCHQTAVTEPRTQRRGREALCAERVPERSKRDHPANRYGTLGGPAYSAVCVPHSKNLPAAVLST